MSRWLKIWSSEIRPAFLTNFALELGACHGTLSFSFFIVKGG